MTAYMAAWVGMKRKSQIFGNCTLYTMNKINTDTMNNLTDSIRVDCELDQDPVILNLIKLDEEVEE